MCVHCIGDCRGAWCGLLLSLATPERVTMGKASLCSTYDQNWYCALLACQRSGAFPDCDRQAAVALESVTSDITSKSVTSSRALLRSSLVSPEVVANRANVDCHQANSHNCSYDRTCNRCLICILPHIRCLPNSYTQVFCQRHPLGWLAAPGNCTARGQPAKDVAALAAAMRC